MKKFEKILKALGNANRLKIVQFLKKKGIVSVYEISSNTKCSYKATSKHLSILLRVDIVDREQKMFEGHYKLSSDMDALAKIIIEQL